MRNGTRLHYQRLRHLVVQRLTILVPQRPEVIDHIEESERNDSQNMHYHPLENELSYKGTAPTRRLAMCLYHADAGDLFTGRLATADPNREPDRVDQQCGGAHSGQSPTKFFAQRFPYFD